MPSERYFDFEELAEQFAPPVLIVSTAVGRGMYTIGEAIQQRLSGKHPAHHVTIEDFAPPEVVNEDLERYKYISNNFPALLYLVYKVPLFYYRKYLREKLFNAADLKK